MEENSLSNINFRSVLLERTRSVGLLCMATMNDIVVSELVEKEWYTLCEWLGLDDERAISQWWSKLRYVVVTPLKRY